MSIESNIIRSNVQKTSLWSGGKTTELFIYPEGSEYGERNFKCRISSATVEVESSAFTKLEGYERYLMILQGCMKIKHDDEEWISLEPYQVDCFGGGQETVSEGKVRDFNVMLTSDFNAELVSYSLDLNQWIDINDSNAFIHFVYCVEGTAQIQLEQHDKMQRHFLYEGDGFFLESDQLQEQLIAFQMKALKGSGRVVHVKIFKNSK